MALERGSCRTSQAAEGTTTGVKTVAHADAVPASHPRAQSLALRERLVDGFHRGLVTESGLIAHGRGEALDYLLGERTHDFGRDAISVCSALLTLAKHPVLSINGNAAALAAEEYVALAQKFPRLLLEVNLFYFTEERASNIIGDLKSRGAEQVLLSRGPDSVLLPGSDNPRRAVHPEGMARADVVLLALEDGDRCEALLAAGKKAICIDLNPLSRTAQKCNVSIIDEVTRALPLLRRCLHKDQEKPASTLEDRITRYDNKAVLARAIDTLRGKV